MSPKRLFAAGLTIVLLAGLGLWPVEIVTVRLPRADNQVIAAIRVGEEDRIVLTYRHSVELSTVEGIFKVGEDFRLQAVETRMESVGTGLPNAEPVRTKIQNGWQVVDEGLKPIETLRFFIVPINRPRLTIAGRAVDLSSIPGGTLIEIAAGKMIAAVYLFYRSV